MGSSFILAFTLQPRTGAHFQRGGWIVKRLLLCLVLLGSLVAIPGSALAWPPFVVFTFHSDPSDPLRTTSTGWFQAPGDIPLRYGFSWNRQIPALDFWWQTQHWTSGNAIMSFVIEDDRYDALDGWRLDGGLENLYGDWLDGLSPLGNDLDHNFDFTMSSGSSIFSKGAGGGPFFVGTTYTCTMNYVNPTSHGSYYTATGTFYVTYDVPAPSQAPGIPEPSPLALVILGVGAVIIGKRSPK